MNQLNLIEFLGLATGAAAIGLGIKQYTATWPLIVLSNVFFGVLFWETTRYADVGFRIAFILLAVYGWYVWTRERGSEMRVSRIDPQTTVAIALFFILSGLSEWFLLRTNTYNTNLLDVSAVIFTFAGQYLFARKFIEGWYLFIMADIFSISAYLGWHLYFLATLNVLTFGMCLIGIWHWRKALERATIKLYN